jgi:thiol-disulfide isomerase/thioredoxin
MKAFRSIAIAIALFFSTGFTGIFAAEPLAVGQPAPAFTYHLLDGGKLSPNTLRGHPYLLWMVASWCPSCQTGSDVVASHIDFLRSHGVRVVEMQLAKDLGRPGPGLQAFHKAVGAKANAPNWYWGVLTDAQTAALDPKGDMDLYYLVDAHGKIVAINGNPAVTWDAIERFATTKMSQAAPRRTAQIPGGDIVVTRRSRFVTLASNRFTCGPCATRVVPRLRALPSVRVVGYSASVGTSPNGPAPNGLIGVLTLTFDPSKVTVGEIAAAAKAGLESDPHDHAPVRIVYKNNS